MSFMARLEIIIIIVPAIVLTHTGQAARCRFKGTLSLPIVDCRRAHIKVPPSNLTNSTYILKLSYNPELTVPRHYFRRKSVGFLQITHCRLSKSFPLPANLMSLDLSHNLLTYGAIKRMLSDYYSNLNYLDLSSNRIVSKDHFAILRNFTLLKTFVFAGNTLDHLGKNHVKYLSNLEVLDLSNTKLKIVSDFGFHGMKNLSILRLQNNQIKSLPVLAFKDCIKLRSLYLTNNSLHLFPDLKGLPYYINVLDMAKNNISDFSRLGKVGISHISILNLKGNRIPTIPERLFQNITVFLRLDLSSNKISILGPKSFGNLPFIGYLDLSNNQIHSLSAQTFQGIKRITGGLFLHMNKLTVLPSGLFRGMHLAKVLLHGNKISKVDRPFDGILAPPRLVVVYDNPLQYMNDSFLSGLTPATMLYVSCEHLRYLHLGELRGIALLCVPQKSYNIDFVDQSIADSLSSTGFVCKKKRSRYRCQPCQSGTYNDGSPSCIPCARGGFFSDSIGQTYCKTCPLGQVVKYGAGRSALSCSTCPIGTDTNQLAGTRSCFCLPGFARRDRFDKCKKCTTTGVDCKNDYQNLKEGFWWQWPNTSLFEKYACFTQNLDNKGFNYKSQCNQFLGPLPKPYVCPIKGACLGGIDAKCSVNYTGILCDVCAPYYYRHLRSCIHCPGLVWSVLRMIIVVFSFVTLCIVIRWADKKYIAEYGGRTVADVVLSSLKIILGFYQILSVTLALLVDIPWPRTMVSVTHYFRYFEMQLLSIGSFRCINPQFEITAIHEMIFSLSATLGIPLLLLIILTIRIAFISKKNMSYDLQVNQLKRSFYRAISIFLFTTYPLTARRVIQMLPSACVQICSDRAEEHCQYYVRADFRVKCAQDEPRNHVYTVIAYIGLIVPIGLPLLMFILIKVYKQRAIIDEQNLNHYELFVPMEDFYEEGEQEKEEAQEHHHMKPMEFAVHFLYENYKPSAWYWELIEMIRKLSFTIGLVMFGSDTRTNLGIFITLSGFFAILYAYKKPMKDHIEHKLQMISLFVIFANTCAGELLKAVSSGTTMDEDRADLKALSILLLLLNVLIIVVIFSRVFVAIFQSAVYCYQNKRCTFSELKHCCTGFCLICKIGHPVNDARSHSEHIRS